MAKRESKKSSAWSNPILSKAIDTTLTDTCTAIAGNEFAEMFVPFWKDILQNQNSQTVKAFLAHLNKMFNKIEATVMQEFRNNGEKEILLTHLEVKKMQVFATRLQDKCDMDVIEYFKLLRHVISEMMEEVVPDDSAWQQIVEDIRSEALEYLNKISPEQLSGSALGIIRSTATYYLEELAFASQTSLECDPIYSLPPGVQPSTVLELRITNWQRGNLPPAVSCNCNTKKEEKMSTRLMVIPSSQLNKDVVLLHQFVHFSLHMPHILFTGGELQHQCTHTKEATKAVKKICHSIDSFIDKIFSVSSHENSDDIIDVSLTIIQELIDSGFPLIATPFLVTLLHGTVTLSHPDKSRAYQYLVKTLANIRQNGNIGSFEKWFFKQLCEYIPTQTELPDLPTTLINLTNFLFGHKSKELLSEAIDCIFSKTRTLCTLEQILSLYRSQIGLLPANAKSRSVIYFLHTLLRNEENKKNTLDVILEAVWLNPDLSEVAAKAVTCLLPFDFFSLVNSSKSLAIPPEECDIRLYKLEKDIEGKVLSNEISSYDAALQYLDLMVDGEYIHNSYQKVLCLLKAARYLASEVMQVPADSLVEQTALKNAVVMLAYDASQLASKYLQPGNRIFALATAYKLIRSAANIDLEDTMQHSCIFGIVARGLLRNLIHSSQFTYLLSQPMTVNDFWVAAASYMEKVSALAQEAYIQKLLQIPERLLPLRSALLHYQNLETCYKKGQTKDPHFKERRITAMTKLLSETKWTTNDVSHVMMTNVFQRNDEGFINAPKHLGAHLEIAELKGVVFNYDEESPSIEVVIKPAKDGNGLLSYRDILEILQLNSNEATKVIFSLDPPSGTERYHPFMQMRCYPTKLKDTEFMQSLFHADYILKFLTTGMEVSAKPPFNLKPIQESLIIDLPESLEFLRHPPYTQGASYMSSHRYWIEAEQVYYDEDITDTQAVYYIDKVNVEVKSRPLIVTLNGNTVDAKHSENGPDAYFARKLTENYDKIAEHFRIFARVKELSKLQFIVKQLHARLKVLQEKYPKNFESFNKEFDYLCSLCPIKSNPDSCLWVPATFNNFVYGGVHISPSSSHFDYLKWSGKYAPSPDECPIAQSASEFSDGWNLMECFRASLEPAARGIKIEIVHEHKIDSRPSNNEFLCVRLGDPVTFAEGATVAVVSTITSKQDPTVTDQMPIEVIRDTLEKETITSQESFAQELDETVNDKEKTDKVQESVQLEKEDIIVDENVRSSPSHPMSCVLDPKGLSLPDYDSSKEQVQPIKVVSESYNKNQLSLPLQPAEDTPGSQGESENHDSSDSIMQHTAEELKDTEHQTFYESPGTQRHKETNEKRAHMLEDSDSTNARENRSQSIPQVSTHSKALPLDDKPNLKCLASKENEICVPSKENTVMESNNDFSDSETASELEYEEETTELRSTSEESQILDSTETLSVEFDIESILSCATKHHIMFTKRGTYQDTLSANFCKSLVNMAIFGSILNDSRFADMLKTSVNFNETSFHPNMLACHQIKTAIVLRKIIELHYKQGTEGQILM